MPWFASPLTIETDLPKLGGSYALFLRLEKNQFIQMPRFGEIEFPCGHYVYSGNARGSGGLQARVARHIRHIKRKHWHIDWFRPYADLMGVYYQLAPDSDECNWSKTLSLHHVARIILPGFGSSDCRRGCPAHLIHFGFDFSAADILAIIDRSQKYSPDE